MTSRETRDTRRREQTQQRQSAIRSALQSSIADLDDRELDEVLAAARATGGIGLRELADHLQAHPDALLSGSSDGPKVLLRLLGLLAAAGHPVVLPRCTDCGKQTADLPRTADTGRICQACGAKSYRDDCSRCGRPNTRIAARRPEGRICYSCYRTVRLEPCARCGRDQHAVARLKDGGALCSRCWTPPQRPCARCGRFGRAVFVGDDGPLCVNCYRRHERPRALCGRCNRNRIVSRRGKNGEPDLCESCNPVTTATCSRCGRDRPGHATTTASGSARTARPAFHGPARAAAAPARSPRFSRSDRSATPATAYCTITPPPARAAATSAC